MLSPIGSSKSKTIFSFVPRPAIPITSLTWTSRQARTQRLHSMQASSCTAIAGWLRSGAGTARDGNRLSLTSSLSAHCQSRELGSCAAAREGWSPTSNSNTALREKRARSLAVCTFIPGEGWRTQEAAKTRSPSISTMQARQLPSARYPGFGNQHRCGISVPRRSATCQIVSPGAASTSAPSRKKRIGSVMSRPPFAQDRLARTRSGHRRKPRTRRLQGRRSWMAGPSPAKTNWMSRPHNLRAQPAGSSLTPAATSG